MKRLDVYRHDEPSSRAALAAREDMMAGFRRASASLAESGGRRVADVKGDPFWKVPMGVSTPTRRAVASVRSRVFMLAVSGGAVGVDFDSDVAASAYVVPRWVRARDAAGVSYYFTQPSEVAAVADVELKAGTTVLSLKVGAGGQVHPLMHGGAVVMGVRVDGKTSVAWSLIEFSKQPKSASLTVVEVGLYVGVTDAAACVHARPHAGSSAPGYVRYGTRWLDCHPYMVDAGPSCEPSVNYAAPAPVTWWLWGDAYAQSVSPTVVEFSRGGAPLAPVTKMNWALTAVLKNGQRVSYGRQVMNMVVGEDARAVQLKFLVDWSKDNVLVTSLSEKERLLTFENPLPGSLSWPDVSAVKIVVDGVEIAGSGGVLGMVLPAVLPPPPLIAERPVSSCANRAYYYSLAGGVGASRAVSVARAEGAWITPVSVVVSVVPWPDATVAERDAVTFSRSGLERSPAWSVRVREGSGVSGGGSIVGPEVVVDLVDDASGEVLASKAASITATPLFALGKAYVSIASSNAGGPGVCPAAGASALRPAWEPVPPPRGGGGGGGVGDEALMVGAGGFLLLLYLWSRR